MNTINQKTISINIFQLVLPLFVLLFIQVAVNAQSYTPEEQNCFNMVQGKVAYDQLGTKAWNDDNIRKLCKGATNPADTISCFKNIISSFNDWNRGINECSGGNVNNAVNVQNLSGKWAMFEGDGKKYDNFADIKQNGTSVTLNNGYGSEETVNLEGSKLSVRAWKLTGTVSADRTRIDWSNGFYWTKNPAPTPADSGTITRLITIKNNSGMSIYAFLVNRSIYDLPSNRDDLKSQISKGDTGALAVGQSNTMGRNITRSIDEDVELIIRSNVGENSKPYFKVALPKNKDLTTFCYEVTGTYFVPSVKTCDGSPTYEAAYIAFKNESAITADMWLTYYPLGGSTTKTAKTEATTLGYSRKLYLPLDADTNRKMTFSVNMLSGSNLVATLISKDVSLSDFDTVGSSCYKTWGSGLGPKASPCSLNPNARTIKLWNNAGYSASLKVTYYDKDQTGKDVEKTVNTNDLEVTQTDTIEVPQGTSLTPVKIEFRNKWNGNKTFSTMNASANFTGELCYKVEGTTFAPTAATCDDTVGDTSGKTRQIRFQNDAGYDANMIVTYFEDQVINGTTIAMPKFLSTGMINGLSGKFRLVTIPKNTSKGQSITIVIQGNATVKGNDAIYSTTLPADFASSPQPCFKVTGTLFDPSGGKCNQ